MSARFIQAFVPALAAAAALALIAPATQAQRFNWRDMENIWVTINPATGLVCSTEVGPASPTLDRAASILKSREIATSKQAIGGR